jgi:hypothetical protein
MRELRVVIRCVGWVLGSIALGALALWRLVRIVRNWEALTGGSVRCPRGHRNSMLGVWQCASCGSNYDGWAFRPCPTCTATARFVACERCGLAIRSPLGE